MLNREWRPGKPVVEESLFFYRDRSLRREVRCLYHELKSLNFNGFEKILKCHGPVRIADAVLQAIGFVGLKPAPVKPLFQLSNA